MDTERAKILKQSPDWNAVCKELDLWIQTEVNKLRNCRPEDLNNIQVRINLLEEVKSLPQIVIDREE
jgi:hypothetical protein